MATTAFMMLISNVTAILIGLGVLALVVHLTTIYMHRSVTHGTVRYTPWLESAMHNVHTMFTGINARQWSAVHNYHHLFPDRHGNPGDPHSPVIEGVWQVVFFNIYYYLKAAKDPRVWAHPFVQERLATIRRRPVDRLGNRAPLLVWIAAMILFGWKAGLIMGVVFLVPYLLLNGAVNGLAHHVGYKNFPSAAGFNLRVLALLTGGEGLHNNHHSRFTSPFFASRRVEWLFESGGLTIRALCALGLARVVSPAPSA
jgi:stearoyl-CoA desaturase (delta-9 desaturase)